MEYSINDFNNSFSSNCKLMINDTLEFYVHSNLLSQKSLFFNCLFNHDSFKESNIILFEKVEKALKKKEIYCNEGKIKYSIQLPQLDLFFDILLWMYSNDFDRIISTADEDEIILGFISLSEFIELESIFIDTLISKNPCKFTNVFYKCYIWSKDHISFNIVVKLIENLNKKDQLLSILNWLNNKKTFKVQYNVESNDYLEAYNYIKENELIKSDLICYSDIESLLVGEINHIIDFDFQVNKHIINSKFKIFCIVCKKSSNNINYFNLNTCESMLYHPGNYNTLQKQIISNICEHETCKRKCLIDEFSCCHQGSHIEGCCMSDGSHMLLINDEVKSNSLNSNLNLLNLSKRKSNNNKQSSNLSVFNSEISKLI